jgi:hypothetical protein
MTASEALTLATTAALAVFAARAASSLVGGPGTIKGLAAELGGGILGVWLATKIR